ncbi:MAG: hypothetical protein JWM59_259 [Verrucomicrobiales bacterium]|nr:hypothetical protein [Verrucomicrobiales bacterium]
MRAGLVTEALQRGRFTRSGQQLEGVIAHSSRGSRHTSAAWQKSLSLLRMASSKSRTANCYDNATMESFWASSKPKPATRSEPGLIIHDCIDAFHNNHRLHTPPAFGSPININQSKAGCPLARTAKGGRLSFSRPGMGMVHPVQSQDSGSALGLT